MTLQVISVGRSLRISGRPSVALVRTPRGPRVASVGIPALRQGLRVLPWDMTPQSLSCPHPLTDTGTLAASLGFVHLPTISPVLQQFIYTQTSTVQSLLAVQTGALTTATYPIPAIAQQFEFRFDTFPAGDFPELFGCGIVSSHAGAVVGSSTFGIRRVSGQLQVVATGGIVVNALSATPIVTVYFLPSGAVGWMLDDVDQGTPYGLNPTDKWSPYIFVNDGLAVGEVCSGILITSAVEQLYLSTVGAVDRCGNLIGPDTNSEPPAPHTGGTFYEVTAPGVSGMVQYAVGDLVYLAKDNVTVTRIPKDSLSYAEVMALLDGKQPLAANLTAEAGLTGAADKVSYFTGLGAKALTSLTAYGRSLIALADRAGLLSFLSLTQSDVGLSALTNDAQVKRSEMGSAGGVPTLDGNGYLNQQVAAAKIFGTLDISNMPAAVVERLVNVDNQAARYLLTTATVQLGDTVQDNDTGLMWYVIDEANLGNAAGYREYTAGTAAAVPWTGITSKPDIIRDIAAVTGSTNDILQLIAGTWVGRSMSQLFASLGFSTGTTAQYWRADKSLSTFATDAVAAITTTTEGALIHGATSKTTPVGADEVGFWDSVSGLLKKISFDDLWAWISGKASAVFAPIATNSTTWATLLTMTSSTYDGQIWFVSDIGVNGSLWRKVPGGTTWKCTQPNILIYSGASKQIVIGGTGATYTQSGTTVTVTWTAHGIYSVLNGGVIYLTQSTGALLTGWFTNFQIVDANTFTCTSTVSQTDSGNLGAQTGNVDLPTLATVKGGVIGATGAIRSRYRTACKANTNSKIFYATYGITGPASSHATANNAGTLYDVHAQWVDTGNMINPISSMTYGTAAPGTTPTAYALSNLADLNQGARIQLSNGADWMALLTAEIFVDPS